jgi:HSP20 family molecular chaperone IbpA
MNGRPPPQAAGVGGKSARSALRGDTGEEAARAAQLATREASKQIEAAAKSVDTARSEAENQISQIHDQYDARSEVELAREEAAFDNQRLKGYERLKDLKLAQEKEMRRIRRDGEREKDQLSNYYLDASYETRRSGDEKLRELMSVQGRTVENAQATKNDDVKLAQDTFHRQYEEVRDRNEKSLAKLTEDTAVSYERIKNNSMEATEKADSSYRDSYESRLKQTTETLNDLDKRAAEGIREVRRDTSQKLSAYSSRQSDPFYRMLDLNAQLEDSGDHYTFTATIPEHEQSHVSVSVKGNQLVLSGSRRSEEKLEIEPGRTQGTNAFQSYLETFPIAWPVDAARLSRQFEGDQLTVKVPKKTEYGYKSNAQDKAQVARAKVERPNFPANLPHVSQDPFKDPAPIDPLKKRKGSGTLA